MLSSNPRERFYRTKSGIAFIINIIPNELGFNEFIGVHVTKLVTRYQYDSIRYQIDGTCPDYDEKFTLIEPTTIKESGFTKWFETCMRAKHPANNFCVEGNTNIVTMITELGDEIYIVSPAPKGADYHYSFLVSKDPLCNELELCDIRKYGRLKFKWNLVHTAFAYDNPANDTALVDVANTLDEDAIELQEPVKRRVAPKSEVFELLETSNPEKFVLCNLETEEAFTISKRKLKDYIEF